MRLSALLLSGLIWAGAQGAFAHDTFFLPAPPTPEGELVLDLGSATHFPTLETPVRAERAVGLQVRQGGAPLEWRAEGGPTALRIFVARPAPSDEAVVARIAFAPRDIDVPPAEVAEYMGEIGADPEVRAAFEAAAARDGVTRETYAKTVKAYVCAAACRVDDSPSEGGALEFFPVGQGAFVLHRAEAPVAGQAVFLSTQSGERHALVTDLQGRVAIPAEASGTVLLTAVVLRPPASEGARFTSEWAALTFTAGTIRAR